MTDLDQKSRNFSIDSILSSRMQDNTSPSESASSSSTPKTSSDPLPQSAFNTLSFPLSLPNFTFPDISPLITASGTTDHFNWFTYARYRNPRGDLCTDTPKKRKYLSRCPRIPFNSEQLSILESKFKEAPYLSGSDVQKLAKELDMSDVRVKIWFQNRRAREKRERQGKLKQQEASSSPDVGQDDISEDRPPIKEEKEPGIHEDQDQR